ncbi:hypothetical protein ABZY05_04925 [Streptomyces canus]|uniref:hypothetical protein n=1 Tax=Streptomyces canus TaxID=58343 RepID=UPI0033B7BA10
MNTFDVHRVLHLARAHGVATPLFSTLQRGYFAGEHNPFDKDELVRVAASGRTAGRAKGLPRRSAGP